MNKPSVAIVIPCLNSENYIAESIHSALEQTYPNCEVIVINDGSTDNSLEVIEGFCNRVRVISTANHGACHARNIGWRAANGQYVKFLDADDVLDPEIVEKQVQCVEGFNENCYSGNRIVFSHVIYTDESGIPLSGAREFNVPPDPDEQLIYLMRNNIETPGPLHSVEVLRKEGGFDETLSRGQEYDLHLRLAAAGYSFVYLPATAAYARKHNAESRISNRDRTVSEPLDDYVRFSRRYEKLASLRNGSMPPEATLCIARNLWQSGRKVLRRGFRREADQYFLKAKALSPKCCVSGSFLYRSLVRGFNPCTAEKVVGFLKKHF